MQIFPFTSCITHARIITQKENITDVLFMTEEKTKNRHRILSASIPVYGIRKKTPYIPFLKTNN